MAELIQIGLKVEVKGGQEAMATMDGIENGAGKAGSAFAKLAGHLTTMVAAVGLARAAMSSFQDAIDFERQRVAFGVFLGDMQKGTILFNQLKAMADKTPFGTKDLTSAAQTLMQYGIAAKEVLPTLKMLGDVSSGDSEKMKALANVFGQISSAGKLSGQDLMQLINAGFNPLQEMSEKSGKSMATLRQEMEKGQISFQQVKDAFISVTKEGGKFHGMMDTMGETLGGKFSTMQDSLSNLGVSILTSLRPVIDFIINGITSIANLISGLPEPVRAFIAVALTGVTAIGALTAAAKLFGVTLSASFGVVGLVITGIVAAVAAIASAVNENTPLERIKKTTEALAEFKAENDALKDALKGKNENEKVSFELGSQALKLYPQLAEKVDVYTLSIKELKKAMDEEHTNDLAKKKADQWAANFSRLSQVYGDIAFKQNQLATLDTGGMYKDWANNLKKEITDLKAERDKLNEAMRKTFTDAIVIPPVLAGNKPKGDKPDGPTGPTQLEKDQKATLEALQNYQREIANLQTQADNGDITNIEQFEKEKTSVWGLIQTLQKLQDEGSKDPKLAGWLSAAGDSARVLSADLKQLKDDREAVIATAESYKQINESLNRPLKEYDDYIKNLTDDVKKLSEVQALMKQGDMLKDLFEKTGNQGFLADLKNVEKQIDETVKKTESLQNALRKIGKELQELGSQSALKGIYSIGEAFGKGTDAGHAFADSMKAALLQLLDTLPTLLLSVGLQLLSERNPMGWAFVGMSMGTAFAGGAIHGAMSNNSNGNVFGSSGQMNFANGGLFGFSDSIVSRPTTFAFAGGAGLMGEAGPEAIMPLFRTTSGALGVRSNGGSGTNVTINVINNSGERVETKERQEGNLKITDIIIGTVKDNMAQGGFDSVMAGRYGTKAQGVRR